MGTSWQQAVGSGQKNSWQVVATVAHVDVLVSWNFRHIVNLGRIRLFNAVNLEQGYGPIEIRSPKEVLANEQAL